jgi:hypothetical protein
MKTGRNGRLGPNSASAFLISFLHVFLFKEIAAFFCDAMKSDARRAEPR